MRITRTGPPAEVHLEDVRAASEIYVTYDFDRDGYVILQDRITDRNGFIERLVEKEEVAFIPAWNEENNEDR